MPTEMGRAAWLAVLIGVPLCACNGLFTSTKNDSPAKESAANAADSAPEKPAPRDGSSHSPPRDDPDPPLEDPPLEDTGIFSDLDADVVTECPSWLEPGPLLQVTHPGSKRTWLALEGVVVCEAKGPHPQIVSALTSSTHTQDIDKDGYFDSVDVLRGAKKTVINGAAYKNNYRKLDFPRGDVPRNEGVCTDVIIRSLRNAGLDLQELLAEDIAKRPSAYPMVKKPDPNIDHRRVRTLLPYFSHAFSQIPSSHEDSAHPYLPGDIIFIDIKGDPQPEHLGIVSDRLGPSGFPLVINNWTDGTVTRHMDLLGRFDVTHRFRIPQALALETRHSGLEGVLLRRRLEVPESAQQVLLVTLPLWTSSGGVLTRYQRSSSGSFQQVGEQVQVRVGERGLGSGRGLHKQPRVAPEPKQEGDRRAPAGVFGLGTAFGRAKKAPYQGAGWPYRALTTNDFWIDDPTSPDYNRWITAKDGSAPLSSSERLMMYSLGLVVEHNTREVQPGAGSAIFIHPWKAPETPTVGCTALAEDNLREVLGWLDPKARPVLVQTADRVY